jgi:hypothetical protein
LFPGAFRFDGKAFDIGNSNFGDFPFRSPIGRAAIYVRVSTDNQTIETQLRELRQIAKRRGWEVVHEYHDAGVSGSKGREPDRGWMRC